MGKNFSEAKSIGRPDPVTGGRSRCSTRSPGFRMVVVITGWNLQSIGDAVNTSSWIACDWENTFRRNGGPASPMVISHRMDEMRRRATMEPLQCLHTAVFQSTVDERARRQTQASANFKRDNNLPFAGKCRGHTGILLVLPYWSRLRHHSNSPPFTPVRGFFRTPGRASRRAWRCRRWG